MLKRGKVDEYGRVLYDTKDLLEIKLRPKACEQNVFAQPGPDIEWFNAACSEMDHRAFSLLPPPKPTISAQDEHRRRQDRWMIPDEISQIDVRRYVLDLCQGDAEVSRIHLEMDMFERLGLVPVLRVMIYLISYFRITNTVWGVGRGSSVASFVLYKIGVHKVNSLAFGLDIREFLKSAG